MSQKISRRRLLAASAAAPLLLNAPLVLGAPTRRAPALERLSVAIIGCGKMANDYHIPELLRQGDVQVTAVCEVDATRRAHAKKRVEEYYSREKKDFKGCDAYADFREVIAREDIDAVCIATPDHWHAIPLIEACKAKKDVYCEKPLTLSIAEAKRCVEAARKYERVVQTGSQQRSNVFGAFREGVELIRSGGLGKVSRVTVGVGAPSKFCDLPEEEMEPGLEWDLWLGAAPKRPYNSILSPRGVHNHFPAWRSYREYSGGGHTDMGAHHYDIALWALDLDHTGPVEIIPPDDEKAETGVKYRFANGVEIEHGGPSGCMFYGERGTMHLDRGVLRTNPEELLKTDLGDKRVQLYKSPGHHRNWLDCIKTREKPIADVEVGARAVSLIHLGNLAYWERRKFAFTPEKWEFANAADNRFLDYERRDPWGLPTV